jgi:transporter family protein
MKAITQSWQFFALLSAIFAAMTAIFGKIGVENVNSNLATFIRTIVILLVAATFVTAQSAWRGIGEVSSRTLVFLVLSGIATGLSWLCYYRALQLGPASRVAPVDKLSVVFVAILAVAFLGESGNWKSWLGIAMIAAGSIIVSIS